MIVAIVLGAVVIFGRVYVGAHLPLDVIGGVALGVVAGSAVGLMVRPPAPATAPWRSVRVSRPASGLGPLKNSPR